MATATVDAVDAMMTIAVCSVAGMSTIHEGTEYRKSLTLDVERAGVEVAPETAAGNSSYTTVSFTAQRHSGGEDVPCMPVPNT